MPLTNTLWYVPCHDQDAGQPATGWGQPEVGVQDGTLPPSCWWQKWFHVLFPLLGSIPQSKPRQSTGRLPCSAPPDQQQWGPCLGKGYPQMGKGPGVSLPRELPYRRLPSQPRHPLDSGQKQLREHSGSLAGSRESHGDSFGKLLAAGCYCQPQPASPGSAAAAAAGSWSWQHGPQPPDQHRAHLCIVLLS